MEDIPEINIALPKWLENKKKYDLKFMKNKYKTDKEYRDKQIEKKAKNYRERKRNAYLENNGTLDGFSIRTYKRHQDGPIPI